MQRHTQVIEQLTRRETVESAFLDTGLHGALGQGQCLVA